MIWEAQSGRIDIDDDTIETHNWFRPSGWTDLVYYSIDPVTIVVDPIIGYY